MSLTIPQGRTRGRAQDGAREDPTDRTPAIGVPHVHLAALLLLLTLFFRQSLTGLPGPDPFLPMVLVVVVASGWHVVRHGWRTPPLGPVEALVVLYLAWNLFSLAWPQEADGWAPGPQAPLPTWRFILTGVAIPLLMYVVGRVCFRSPQAVRHLLWATLAFGAYSAVVSIGQFHLPQVVWPRYIVEAPNWPGRANGVPNQPVVNGLMMIAGYLVSMTVMTRPDVDRLLRGAAGVIAAATAYGVFLTYTRAAWLGFVVVTIAGAVWMRGAQRQFVAVLVAMALALGIGWSTFTSSDREAGGVGSVSEIDDRLNLAATQLWAFEQEPLVGWGIGTFATVNVRHHQQFSAEVPWERGYAVASHQTELGVLAELGLVGLALWLSLLVMVWRRATRAVRESDDTRLEGRPFAVLALLAFVALLVSGLTVDLRYFEFINALTFLMLGSAVGVGEASPDRSSAPRPVARRRPLVLAR